ncbi:MAG: hypothetical protein ACRERC_02440 [Candidatus Binatia bacterium]
MTSNPRLLFGSAAAFNFFVAAGLLLLRPSLAPLLQLDPIEGTNLVLVNLTGGFIALFGYAYLRVALDPVTYRPFIALGAIGKLLAVASAVSPWLSGAIAWPLPVLVAVDLLYVVLFVRYLLQTRQ